MRTKQKCEGYTEEAPIIVDIVYKDLVSQVTEEVLVKDTAKIETSKKSKEKTKQCYINHI